MKTLSSIRKSIYFAFVFFGTLIVLSIGYAAYNLGHELANTPLTIGKWNAVIDAVNDADTRISTLSGVVSSLQSGAWTPSWAIMAFNLSDCPDGWTEYTPAQWRFLRGIDSTGTNDTVRALGNIQDDAFEGHAHTITMNEKNNNGISPPWCVVWGAGQLYTRTYTSTAVGWTETRPKNVAVLYCVKS